MLARSAFPFIAVAVALIAQLAADPLLPNARFFFFVAAATITAMYAGFRAAAGAIALSAITVTYFLVEPRFTFKLSRADAVQAAFFVVMTTVLAWLVAEMRRRELRAIVAQNEAVGLERERLQSIMASVPGVVWEAWGSPDVNAQRIDFVSKGVEHLLGYTVQEWLATPNFWLTIVHPDDRDKAAANAAEHFARGGIGTNEFRWMTKDKRAIWVQATSVVISDANGRPVGMRGVTIDINARKRAEDAVRFLSKTSEVLASSLDYEVTLKEAAQLATSRFADMCVIDVIGSGPIADQMFIAHRDPAKQAIAEKLREASPRRNPMSVANEVIRTGQPALGAVDEKLLDRTNLDESLRVVVRELETKSYMVVPIDARGRILGVLSLNSSERDFYGKGDVDLAVLFAKRLAIAIDNALLYQTALAASAAKDEFLATVSHELRTPMTATLGWTRMILSGYLDETTQQTAIEAIDRSTRAQAKLIEDILDVSSIVLGKFKLEMAPIDLRSVVDAATDTVGPAAQAKGMSVHVDTSRWAGVIQGDASRLQQVVWNLLSNAIKFGRKDGTIHVRLERAGSSARLTISDDGIGIDHDFLPHVFDRFRQADGGMTRTHGGLGLGLAIVKHLVELHGGTVAASSDGLGKGSTFTVELPLAVEQSGVSRIVDAAALPRLATRSILVVDDESATLDLVGTILRRCGAHVTLAASADEALLAMNRDHHDLLITDLAMPDVDGLTLLKRVRSRSDGHAAMPAIILTARTDTLTTTQTELVLRKPVDPVVLANEVARALA